MNSFLLPGDTVAETVRPYASATQREDLVTRNVVLPQRVTVVEVEPVPSRSTLDCLPLAG